MDASTQPPNLKCTDISILHTTIKVMDETAKSGALRISALTEVLLAAMESKNRYPTVATVTRVLVSIQQIAEETEAAVSCFAEDIGCNTADKDLNRILEAEERDFDRRFQTRKLVCAQAEKEFGHA